MNNSKLLVCVVLLHASVFLSYTAYADHSWNDYHWATMSKPMTLQVIDNVTEDWDSQLVESISQWSTSIVINPVITSGNDTKIIRKTCAIAKGKLRICNDWYGITGWLGHTVIGFDQNGHIDKARSRLNDSYSKFWTFESKNHVMCHEMGHVFSLGHTSQDGSSQKSCMDLAYKDPLSQWPNQHDFVQVIQNYARKDFYNSYDDGSGVGIDEQDNNFSEPEKGERIFRGPHHEIWKAPREDGGFWIHHILLAPEE